MFTASTILCHVFCVQCNRGLFYISELIPWYEFPTLLPVQNTPICLLKTLAWMGVIDSVTWQIRGKKCPFIRDGIYKHITSIFPWNNLKRFCISAIHKDKIWFIVSRQIYNKFTHHIQRYTLFVAQRFNGAKSDNSEISYSTGCRSLYIYIRRSNIKWYCIQCCNKWVKT